MLPPRLLRVLLLTTFVAVGLTGCDEAEPDPLTNPDPVNFSNVDLDSGVTGSFEGRAFFSMVGEELRLYLYDANAGGLDTESSEYVAFFLPGGMPQPGIYDIRLPGHEEARAYAGYARLLPNDLEVAGERGQITIRSATSEGIEGGFAFDGTAYIPGKTGRGAVRGGFIARPSASPLPAYPFVFPED